MRHSRNPSLPVVTRKVTFRDFAVFQAKLALDGVKDLVLVNLSVIAIVIDMLAGGGRRPRRFYAVIRLGERFDRWLKLHSAKGFDDAEDGGRQQEYLLGSGVEEVRGRRILGSDADTLIERVEDFARRQSRAGKRRPEPYGRSPTAHNRELRARRRDPRGHGPGHQDYDRELEEFDQDLGVRDQDPESRER